MFVIFVNVCDFCGTGLKIMILKLWFLNLSLKSERQTTAYLALLSYGIPSAFGAADFFDVNTNTIIVTIYGIIKYK